MPNPWKYFSPSYFNRADHLAKSYHGKCHSLFVKGLKILVFITGKERQKGKAAKVSLWVA